MDKICQILNNLKSRQEEIASMRKSQKKLARQLRIYHLSYKEIAEVTGLTLQDVKRFI